MPRIQTTRTVRLALLGLRIYLIVLLLLIGFKFVRDFSRPAEKPQAPPAAATKLSRSFSGEQAEVRREQFHEGVENTVCIWSARGQD
jgi:hypothetical protein